MLVRIGRATMIALILTLLAVRPGLAADSSPSIEQLLTSGGALGILTAIVLAFYTGRVTTKTQSDDRVAFTVKMWEERFADERAEKEAWKSQAQQLAESTATMATELEQANERDEEWKRAIEAQLGSPPDRRKT